MLRDLGVHIREIKAHMDCRSPEALIRLMESKSMEIEKKIQTLWQTRQYIDKKIRITQEGQKAVIDTIQIQVLPQRYMITSDYNGPDDTAAVTEALGDHLNYCSRMGLHNATPIGLSLIHISSSYTTLDGISRLPIMQNIQSAIIFLLSFRLCIFQEV